jgi:uncharacterized membrane protein
MLPIDIVLNEEQIGDRDNEKDQSKQKAKDVSTYTYHNYALYKHSPNRCYGSRAA